MVARCARAGQPEPARRGRPPRVLDL